ncbi:MAG TPA: hypothetical protein VHK67_07780 [Rhabdochlamydiaceae bacterium]|jgi:hypothetical protein|nr:hypothetical protein [Rhabdochlamydiaceae bacterium]
MHRTSPTNDRLRPYDSRDFSGPSGKDIRKIAGVVIIAVGVLFTLYGAGSGLSKLVSVSLDHFGLVLLTSTISFIFWSIVATPIGALIVNGCCVAGAILLFGGLPAIPGAVLAAGGAYLYWG